MRPILVLGQPDEVYLSELTANAAMGEVKIVTGDDFEQARDVFFSEIFQWAFKVKPMVVTCRHGWSSDEAKMVEMFAHFTGRSAESIQYYLFDMGVEVKSHSFTQGLVSIKDLMAAIDMAELPETHRLRYQILGELIR